MVVSDRKRATRWYTGKLGLVPLHQEGHWVTVGRKNKGSALHLCQMSEIDAKAKLEPGNSGILLLVEGDFHLRCQELKEAGVEFVEGPIERPWGWDATIRDPDGNELLLMPEG